MFSHYWASPFQVDKLPNLYNKKNHLVNESLYQAISKPRRDRILQMERHKKVNKFNLLRKSFSLILHIISVFVGREMTIFVQ
jgi:hypothetical protein